MMHKKLGLLGEGSKDENLIIDLLSWMHQNKADYTNTFCFLMNKNIQKDKIYENQNQWTSGSDLNEINENLKKIVSDLGISTSRFEECLNNETISDKILN